MRLRVPDEGATVVHDVIRGDTSFEHVHMDDPVIARADGSVLYNFAVAIDDLDAGITHVVRGEDHLSNTPKQLLVLEAARASASPTARCPVYAHLPLLHGPDGKKLSKRHGAASVQELRDAGYLPEAVRNYLALLGWGAGDDETVLSTQELVERFTLERVSRNPARFDEEKLRWLNGVYMRELPVAGAGGGAWKRSPGARAWREAARISQEKIHTLADFWPLAGPLLRRARRRPEGARALARTRRAARALARGARGARAAREPFDEEPIEQRAGRASIEQRGRQAARGLPAAARRAHAARTISPGIFESVALLGREETLRRIDAALAARLRHNGWARGCRLPACAVELFGPHSCR